MGKILGGRCDSAAGSKQVGWTTAIDKHVVQGSIFADTSCGVAYQSKMWGTTGKQNSFVGEHQTFVSTIASILFSHLSYSDLSCRSRLLIIFP
jgi:hypothetical protein